MPRFALEGASYPKEEDQPRAHIAWISSGFIRTFGGEVLRGRDFDARDIPESLPVALVNRSFAEKFWPGQDPIGRKLQLWPALQGTRWLTVVGVVDNVRLGGPLLDSGLTVYTCAQQLVAAGAYYLLRTRGDTRAFAPMAERAVRELDPTQAITRPTAVTDLIADRTWQRRVAAMVFSLFGTLAFALAAIGIYGVIAYHVAQRTAEFGLRLALGAQPGDMIRLVGQECLRIMGFGLTAGLLLAHGLSRVIASVLFETSSQDPAAFLAAPVVLIAAALAAAYVPARRATRVDPIIALREER
jgi:putative ABC transport system permease protein